MIPYPAFKNMFNGFTDSMYNTDVIDIYKFISVSFVVYISYYLFESLLNYQLNNLDRHYYEFLKWNYRIDTTKPLKEDIINSLDKYIKQIKINQFLQNSENLNKTINFYKHSTKLCINLRRLLDDKYRHIFIDCNKFYNYYGGKDNCPINYVKNECENVVCINLQEIYEEEQMINDIEIFDIENKRKYFPLKKDDLCFMTNYAKLNVVRWLIETGIYDYIGKHYM